MKFQGLTTKSKLDSNETALFLQINPTQVLCVYSNEKNAHDEVDFAWYPTAIYNLVDYPKNTFTDAEIDTNEIYQVPDSLLNLFLSIAKDNNVIAA